IVRPYGTLYALLYPGLGGRGRLCREWRAGGGADGPGSLGRYRDRRPDGHRRWDAAGPPVTSASDFLDHECPVSACHHCVGGIDGRLCAGLAPAWRRPPRGRRAWVGIVCAVGGPGGRSRGAPAAHCGADGHDDRRGRRRLAGCAHGPDPPDPAARDLCHGGDCRRHGLPALAGVWDAPVVGVRGWHGGRGGAPVAGDSVGLAPAHLPPALGATTTRDWATPRLAAAAFQRLLLRRMVGAIRLRKGPQDLR